MPYLSASEVVIHEETLYQVYVALPYVSAFLNRSSMKTLLLSIFVKMAEIVTYLLSDEKWPFILNGDFSND